MEWKVMALNIEQVEQIAKEHKLKMEPMSAFYRIEVGGRRMYVTRTKKVSRIDLSGFSFQHPAVKVLDEDFRREHRMGGVQAQIDFSKKEEQVLEAIETGLAFMQALAGDEKVDLAPKYRKEVERILASPPPPRRRASRRGEEAGATRQ